MAVSTRPPDQVVKTFPIRSSLLFREGLVRLASNLAQQGKVHISIWAPGEDEEGEPLYEVTEAQDFSSGEIPQRLGPMKLTCIQTVSDDVDADKVPRMEIYLRGKASRIQVGNPTDTLVGLASRVKEIVEETRHYVWRNWLAMIGVALVAGLLTVGGMYGEDRETGEKISSLPAGWKWAIGGAIAVVLLSLMVIIGRMSQRREGGAVRIINTLRSQAPSFFRRTSDDWIVEAVVAVGSLLIGFLLGKLT